jgi:hypothetical protein
VLKTVLRRHACSTQLCSASSYLRFCSCRAKGKRCVHICRLVLPHLKHRASQGLPVRILELGCWEGRSTCWLLQNAFPRHEDLPPGTQLVCVDHFDLLRTEAGRGRRDALEHNLLLTGLRYVSNSRSSVQQIRDTSADSVICDLHGYTKM